MPGSAVYNPRHASESLECPAHRNRGSGRLRVLDRIRGLVVRMACENRIESIARVERGRKFFFCPKKWDRRNLRPEAHSRARKVATDRLPA